MFKKTLFWLMFGWMLAASNMAWAFCSSGCDCCRCPNGPAQCLGSHSSCEAACGLVSQSVPSGAGGGGGTIQQQMMQGAGIVGNAVGKALGDAIFGNPQQDAANQAAAAKAANQAAEQQRQADQEAVRQQELAKQRILGALKDTSQTPALGLKTGDAADAPLRVTRVQNGFGTTALVPVNAAQGASTENGLQLKLGDDADTSSAQAGQGFDTSGKMRGSDLPPPPPTPASRPIAQKAKLLKSLKAKLKKYEAEEQSLKDKLTQLQQAPTPDPVAINRIQKKIAVKETAKHKIILDLTAADPDASGAGQTSDNPDPTPAGAISTGVSP